MAGKLNSPVDHMFRAAQISPKEWKRLSMKQPGKGAKTHGRMANFDDKAKTDEHLSRRGASHTRTGHIHGPDQGMTAKGAVSAPTKGGGVRSSGSAPTSRAIDQVQKPLFPRSAGKTGNAVRGGSTQPVGGQYGGPSSRPNAPSRLGR